ncbi:TetR/AcrR family transcriptional regulator [Cryobacterium sinapicolor]|uniref:TetR/AcrR family transcriptional regulator n=1 Tax=Cryobacterium sinapicolor TaxID=1259236 RepID=A0ABY2IWK1_9MICO|nr:MULTISPECIES: TetR/AcrR family transcriptional regulator [Cryobacterium]TFC89927.1 TetR/AcrR family transcriptional regulator [Cryobacterium sp. TMT3-29-2]TFC96397.1 TetR/AcrR family transcriptional regulator [Cryobacterium sinapicolor]
MTTLSTKGDATRQRLTESMLQLIQDKGYHGAGLTAVLEHSGAPRGSLYYHFPGGKSQLGSAAIVLTAEQFRFSITEGIAMTDSVDGFVDAVVEGLTGQLVGSDFRAACPVAAVTLDAGSGDAQLRAACRDAYASWIATLQAYLASSHAGDTRGLATAAVCLIEGALVVCRAQRSTEPLVSAARALKLLFEPGNTQGGDR